MILRTRMERTPSVAIAVSNGVTTWAMRSRKGRSLSPPRRSRTGVGEPVVPSEHLGAFAGSDERPALTDGQHQHLATIPGCEVADLHRFRKVSVCEGCSGQGMEAPQRVVYRILLSYVSVLITALKKKGLRFPGEVIWYFDHHCHDSLMNFLRGLHDSTDINDTSSA